MLLDVLHTYGAGAMLEHPLIAIGCSPCRLVGIVQGLEDCLRQCRRVPWLDDPATFPVLDDLGVPADRSTHHGFPHGQTFPQDAGETLAFR